MFSQLKALLKKEVFFCFGLVVFDIIFMFKYLYLLTLKICKLHLIKTLIKVHVMKGEKN